MKILSVILGIGLVGVGGIAIHQSRQMNAANQRIADLEAQLQSRQAQSIAVAATPIPPPLPASITPAPPAATNQPKPAATPAVQTSVEDIETFARLQRTSPEGMARMRETTRALMRSSNPDVTDALDISAEDAERLFDLLATQQQASSNLFAEVREAADQEAARRQLDARMQEIRQSNEAELRQLLGGKYAQWKEYEQTRAAWQQRRDLNAVLEAAGTPLGESQNRALIAALSAEYLDMRNSRQAATLPFRQYSQENQQRLVNAASAHLSPQQLESYRQMLARAAKQEETMMAPFLRAAEAAGAAPSAPAN